MNIDSSYCVTVPPYLDADSPTGVVSQPDGSSDLSSITISNNEHALRDTESLPEQTSAKSHSQIDSISLMQERNLPATTSSDISSSNIAGPDTGTGSLEHPSDFSDSLNNPERNPSAGIKSDKESSLLESRDSCFYPGVREFTYLNIAPTKNDSTATSSVVSESRESAGVPLSTSSSTIVSPSTDGKVSPSAVGTADSAASGSRQEHCCAHVQTAYQDNLSPYGFENESMRTSDSKMCESRSVQASHNLLRKVLLVALDNLYHLGRACEFQSGDRARDGSGGTGQGGKADFSPSRPSNVGSEECYHYHKQVIECGTAGIESLYPYLTIFGPCLLSRVDPSSQHYEVRMFMYNQLTLLRNPYLPQTIVALNEQRHVSDATDSLYGRPSDGVFSMTSLGHEFEQKLDQPLNDDIGGRDNLQYRRDSTKEFLASFQQLSPDHYLLHTTSSVNVAHNVRRDESDNSRPNIIPEAGSLQARRARRAIDLAPSGSAGQNNSPGSSGNDEFMCGSSNLRLPSRFSSYQAQEHPTGRGGKDVDRPPDLDITPTTSSSPTSFNISDELRYEEDMLRMTMGKVPHRNDQPANNLAIHGNVKCDVPGVQWIPTYQYWRARWTDKRTNEPTSRYFSSKRYGFEQAQQLAISARLSAETEGVARVKTTANDDDDTNQTLSSMNEFEDEDDAIEEDEILKQIEFHSPSENDLIHGSNLKNCLNGNDASRDDSGDCRSLYGGVRGDGVTVSENEPDESMSAPNCDGIKNTNGLDSPQTSKNSPIANQFCKDVSSLSRSQSSGQYRSPSMHESFYLSYDQNQKQEADPSMYDVRAGEARETSRSLFTSCSFLKNLPSDSHHMSTHFTDYNDGLPLVNNMGLNRSCDFSTGKEGNITDLIDFHDPSYNGGGNASWVSLSSTSKHSFSSSSRRTPSPGSTSSKPGRPRGDKRGVSEVSVSSVKSYKDTKKDFGRGERKIRRRSDSVTNHTTAGSKRRKQHASGSSGMTPPQPMSPVQGGHNNLGILVSDDSNVGYAETANGSNLSTQMARSPEWKKDYRCWQVALPDSSGTSWLYFFSAKKHGIDKAREMAFACQRTGIPKGAVQLSTIQKLHATRRIKSQLKTPNPNLSQDRSPRLPSYQASYDILQGHHVYKDHHENISMLKDERVEEGSLNNVYETQQQSYSSPIYHNIPSNHVSPYIS